MSALWPDLNFEEDPRLIIGYRKPNGKIECYRIRLHEDTFNEFREIATSTISRLDTKQPRPYEKFGALEEDEYFILDNSSIPNKPAQKQRNDPGTEEIASALAMVADTDRHPKLSSDAIRSPLKMNLYMISYPIGSSYIGFVRQTNPQRSISPGYRYFQYGDNLKRINKPDFVFDNWIDLIIGPEKVVILSDTVVQMLFRDVELVMESVVENMTVVVDAFQDQLPLAPQGIEVLRNFCDRGPRNAKRLYDLVHDRLTDLNLDSENIIQALSKHGLDHLMSNGELNLTDESVPSFFDFIEGRLYHDDHTHEPRRADRYSKRR